MNETRNNVKKYLEGHRSNLENNVVTIGIDAFIDKILRIVKSKPSNGEYIFFNDIAEFGNHLVSRSGKSGQVEACERFTKLGGNAAIMANAMGALSANVNCVADFGYPEINPIFNELSNNNCKLYTIGDPGYTTALEFNDGKIMLTQRDTLHRIDWNTVKSVLGIEKLRELFDSSNLIGLVNWNGMIHYNEIFRGLLDEVLNDHKCNKKQILFVDMADFSERSREDVIKAVSLFKEFNMHYKVVLGLNENEANLLFKVLYPNKNIDFLTEKGQYIFDNIGVDVLVVHTLKNSIAWSIDGNVTVDSLYVNKPKLSTGGGDNFNAGLCFGLLMGLDLEGAMYVANSVTGYYVRNAHSPSYDNLLETLRDWDKLIEK